MWPFVVLGGCVHAGQRISLSALAQNQLKKPNGETSRETGSGRGKEGLKEDRASVDKGRQREAVDNGEQRRTVGLK